LPDEAAEWLRYAHENLTSAGQSWTARDSGCWVASVTTHALGPDAQDRQEGTAHGRGSLG